MRTIGTIETGGLPLVPFRRLASFWSWLPAFRAVAEWGGVNRAAAALRTSPSALSRAVRLLEESLERPLFRREGRGMVLSRHGEELLATLRSSMRALHDYTAAAEVPRGPLRLASTARSATLRLLPALSRLRRTHPALEPSLELLAQPELAPRLLSGRLDVAVALAPVLHPELELSALAPSVNAVYCGRGHPLWGRRAAAVGELLRHPFAAPLEPGLDGFPPELERRVALRSGVIDAGVDACVRGELLAVLPVELVHALGLEEALRPLRAAVVPDTRLFVVRRRPLTEVGDPAGLLVRALSGAGPRQKKATRAPARYRLLDRHHLA